MMTFHKRTSAEPGWFLVVLLPGLLLLAGCESEMPRYDLSGTVTYGGRPVPMGYMVLTPDASAGNVGPASAADIREGRFATRPGSGTIGGPHVLHIAGYDGQAYTVDGVPIPMGKPICKLDIKADLPFQNAEHQIDVPGT